MIPIPFILAVAGGFYLGKKLKEKKDENDHTKLAKGGVLATYEDELNKMTDEQLAAEVEQKMGISAEDVLSDIEERDAYIDELIRSYKQTLASRGEKYASGGDIRTIKGNNFSDKIENGRKFKELIQRVFDAQGKEGYPLEFIKATALSPHAIVKDEGKNYLKGYSSKGTLTHFEFMNNPDFVKALEYVDRPKIRKF